MNRGPTLDRCGIGIDIGGTTVRVGAVDLSLQPSRKQPESALHGIHRIPTQVHRFPTPTARDGSTYELLIESLTSHVSTLRSQISNLRFQTSNPKVQISDLKFQNSDFRSQLPNLKSQISDFQSQFPNPKSQIPNFSPQISTPKFQISDFESQISDFESQISDFESQISNFRSESAPTQSPESPPTQNPIAQPAPPLRIGLAIPGVIDSQAGIVRRSVNLSFLDNRPIVHDLCKALQSREGLEPDSIVLTTDADAATWGEYISWRTSLGATDNPVDRFPRVCETDFSVRQTRAHRNSTSSGADFPVGQAQDVCGTDFRVGLGREIPRRFAHLRLGTGIALGLVIENKLLPRDPNRRTHLPLLVVDHTANALACPCGLRGCLETITSGPAISSQAHQLLGLSNLADLEIAYSKGNQTAIELIHGCAAAIRSASTAIQKEFDVDVISIGGGVMNALSSLLKCLISAEKEALQERRLIPIVPSVLGDDAGVVGVALLAATQGETRAAQ